MKLFFTLASLFFLLLTFNTYSQNWATLGGNNQRNGLTKIIGPDSVITPTWTVNSSQSLWGNSVFTYGDKFVTSRVIFSPSYTAKLECRSLVDGSLFWEKSVYPNSIMYAVGFSEDAIYAHDYSSDSLYALSPIDGSVRWAVQENMFGGNSGVLFACNGDPIVRGKRLDKNNGQTIWFYDYIVPVGPNAGYAIYKNTFYHYSGTINTAKKIFAVDIETGQFKYESIELPGDGDQEWPITIGSDGTIYLKRDGGKLYAFLDTGTEFRIKWEYIPTATEMPGYFGSDLNGNIYIIDNDTVKQLSGGNGKILNKSKVDVDGSFYSTISVDGEGKVYVCNNNYGAAGKMYCFSPDLQTVIWELAVIDLIYCGPSLAKDGTLVIIGSGTQINAYKPNKPLRPVTDFTTDSTIVFAGTGLNFYDQSSYLPTSWQWSFPGGTPSSSTEQNPLNIIYSTEGEYEVALIAANSLGADTLIKKCYLSVVLPVSVEHENEIANDFQLEQNYPNPFNPSTKINYRLAFNTFVSLKVFDVLGNEVASLVNEEKSVGSYEVDFDASQISSGIYFYKLQAGNFVETRKMILLK